MPADGREQRDKNESEVGDGRTRESTRADPATQQPAGHANLRVAFRRAFGKFAYIYLALQILIFLPLQWSRTDADRDVVAYWLAGERVRQDESMFEPYPPPGPHRPDEWYYLYPPFLASAVALAPQARFENFARAWLVFLLAAFWLYAACLARMATGRVSLHGTIVAGAAIGITPGAAQALNMGQADVLLWPLIGAALAFPAARGAGFMSAALVKVLGIWPLVIAWLREGARRVLPSAAAATAGFVLVAVIALGPVGFFNACLEWFRFVLPALGQGQFENANPSTMLTLPFLDRGLPIPSFTALNFSIPFAPILIAHGAGWDPGEQLPTAIRLYLAIASVGAPIATAWFARRQSAPMQFALVVCASLLFSPIFRLYNLPLFLAPFALRMGAREARQDMPYHRA